MKHLFKLLLLPVSGLLFGCNSANQANCLIDISAINYKNPVKIVLQEFKLLPDNSWKWLNADSIVTTKKKLIWPKKYDHSFIGMFNILNQQNQIIGSTFDFIYSRAPLVIKKKKMPNP